MLIIDHVTRDKAEGKIEKFYSRIPREMDIPAPFLVLSSSPGVFERQGGVLEYFSNHDSLNFHVLASIRYIAASIKGYTACIDFNGKLLMAAGLETDELKILVNDPMQAPFEEQERMLLAFIKKSIVDPDAVSREDINALVSKGWKEKDLVDAVFHAANMDIAGTLVKTFSE